jgi:hypothetical protein
MDDLPWGLRAPFEESELLVCDLHNWHLFDDRLVGYQLTDVEWGWTSGGLIVRPRADWNDEDFEQELQRRFGERRKQGAQGRLPLDLDPGP